MSAVRISQPSTRRWSSVIRQLCVYPLSRPSGGLLDKISLLIQNLIPAVEALMSTTPLRTKNANKMEQQLVLDKQQVCRQILFNLRASCLQLLLSAAEVDRRRVSAIFRHVFASFLRQWRSGEASEQLAEARRNSLYRLSGKASKQTGEQLNTRTEEELMAQLLGHHFPNFRELFNDITSVDQCLNQTQGVGPDSTWSNQKEQDELQGALTDDEQQTCAELFMKLHSCYEKKLVELINQEETTLALSKLYEIAAQLVQSFDCDLEPNVDGILLTAHRMMVRRELLLMDAERDEQQQRPFDIYRDPCPLEVVKCVPGLRALSSRLRELRNEWPEQTSLQQAQLLVTRLESFSVRAPLMQYATGLELLLGELQLWESVAAGHVSLAPQLQELSRVLIGWRRAELRAWNNSLDTVSWRARVSASKWLFHLYGLLGLGQDQLQQQQQQQPSQEEVCQCLMTFVESSSCGEFEMRLQLLGACGKSLERLIDRSDLGEKNQCQMCASDTQDAPSWQRNTVMHRIVVNVESYFAQFLPTVRTHLVDCRKPLEKEISDFVKVCKWRDVNFWSVKASVESSHKVVAKQMRAWESVLKAPVLPLLSLQSTGLAAETSADDGKPTGSPTEGCPVFESIDIATVSISDDVLDLPSMRLNRRLNLVRHYCASLRECCTQGNNLMTTINGIDELTTDIVSTATELRALTPSASADQPERRRKEAAHQQARKRKALWELLGALRHAGLSHNRAADNRLEKCLIGMAPRLCSRDTSRRHLLRLLARRALLEQALSKPARDLGPNELQRCRGYADCLISEILALRGELSRVSSARRYLANFTKLWLPRVNGSCAAPGAYHSLKVESKKLTDCIYFLKEWSVAWRLLGTQVLKDTHAAVDVLRDVSVCWPSIEDAFPSSSLPLAWRSPAKMLTLLNDKLPDDAMVMSTLAAAYCSPLADTEHVSKTRQQLHKLARQLSAFAHKALKFHSLPTNGAHSMEANRLASAEDLLHKILTNKLSGNCGSSAPEDETHSLLSVEAVAESLILKIMLGVQGLIHNMPNSSVATEQESPLAGVLVRRGCLEPARNMMLHCGVGPVIEALDNWRTLIRSTVHANEHTASTVSKYSTLLSLLAAEYQQGLDIMVDVVETALHALCKLTNVLLAVFVDLVKQGFCAPADLTVATDNEETQRSHFHDADQAGLGSGEGLRDVSDQITSEDQVCILYKTEWECCCGF